MAVRVETFLVYGEAFIGRTMGRTLIEALHQHRSIGLPINFIMFPGTWWNESSIRNYSGLPIIDVFEGEMRTWATANAQGFYRIYPSLLSIGFKLDTDAALFQLEFGEIQRTLDEPDSI